VLKNESVERAKRASRQSRQKLAKASFSTSCQSTLNHPIISATNRASRVTTARAFAPFNAPTHKPARSA
jgi:hypothetical protein